ncbi:MAG: hypothetical protein GY722_12610 [bacterium]|nr:hypothetical protein [bacterium]
MSGIADLGGQHRTVFGVEQTVAHHDRFDAKYQKLDTREGGESHAMENTGLGRIDGGGLRAGSNPSHRPGRRRLLRRRHL